MREFVNKILNGNATDMFEIKDITNKILCGDALAELKKMPDNSIDCCVTSPPYWSLRDYQAAGQIGVEETPEEFVNKLANIFDEVKRCLKNDATLWLNLGDSYISAKCDYMPTQTLKNGNKSDYIQKDSGLGYPPNRRSQKGYKAKDLVGIPWMVAFELRKRGWWLRCDIVWHKPNPMPESVQDRPTRCHEFIFLMTKSKKYYYDADAIKTKMDCAEHDKRSRISRKRFPTDKINGIRKSDDGLREWANKRDVWTVILNPYLGSHFSTFPENLIVDCIKAGCPQDGIVLDCFMGAGTTALVARKLNRNYIGIELNKEYCKMAEDRLIEELGLFV